MNHNLARSFLVLLKAKADTETLSSINKGWTDWLRDYYQSIHELNDIQDIPFYYPELSSFEDTYQSILEKKSFTDSKVTHKKFSEITFTNTTKFPCFIFFIKKSEKLIEFEIDENFEVYSTEDFTFGGDKKSFVKNNHQKTWLVTYDTESEKAKPKILSEFDYLTESFKDNRTNLLSKFKSSNIHKGYFVKDEAEYLELIYELKLSSTLENYQSLLSIELDGDFTQIYKGEL